MVWFESPQSAVNAVNGCQNGKVKIGPDTISAAPYVDSSNSKASTFSSGSNFKNSSSAPPSLPSFSTKINPSSAPPTKPLATVVATNFDVYEVPADDLKRACSAYGEIYSVKVVPQRNLACKRTSRAVFCFITSARCATHLLPYLYISLLRSLFVASH